MRILIIDADGSLKCRAMSGIEIITMKSIREEDLETIAKLSPDLIFLASRFPGYTVDGPCLQGPQILPLLWKYLPSTPIIGLGNWWHARKMKRYNLSGVETRERFWELFKEFLVE